MSESRSWYLDVMDDLDLNLLLALDALLTENSVTGAARRLGLSSSAMSRTLARLRVATGDPLLVRAGRGLVPTPRAATLRDPVHALTREAQMMLRPVSTELDLASLALTFTIRVNEGFMACFAAPLVAAVSAVAPHVRLRFAPKPLKDAGPIRDGTIDLEIGVLGIKAPEVRTRTLFRDSFVGVVRIDHPLLEDGVVTPERYAGFGHVVASRNGRFNGPVDDALAVLGLTRTIVAVVPGYPDAIRMARCSDLVALAPYSCLGMDATETDLTIRGVRHFELPVRTPDIAISALWHPRMDNDPVHRWMRNTITSLCRSIHLPRYSMIPKSRERFSSQP